MTVKEWVCKTRGRWGLPPLHRTMEISNTTLESMLKSSYERGWNQAIHNVIMFGRAKIVDEGILTAKIDEDSIRDIQIVNSDEKVSVNGYNVALKDACSVLFPFSDRECDLVHHNNLKERIWNLRK